MSQPRQLSAGSGVVKESDRLYHGQHLVTIHIVTQLYRVTSHLKDDINWIDRLLQFSIIIYVISWNWNFSILNMILDLPLKVKRVNLQIFASPTNIDPFNVQPLFRMPQNYNRKLACC